MRKLAMLLALFALGCDVRGRVLVVGDSNASLSADAFTSFLYGGYKPVGSPHTPAPAYVLTFAAVPGAAFRDHATWVPSLEDVDASADFDAVVINMGVNDGAAGNCTTGLADKIDAVYGALPADVPIIVIDAPYATNSLFSTSCLVDVNLALQAAHGRWSASPHSRPMTYINVNLVLDALGSAPRFGADGVHFSQAGKYLVAEAVRVALEDAL